MSETAYFRVGRITPRGVSWLIPGADYDPPRIEGAYTLFQCFTDYTKEHAVAEGCDVRRTWSAFNAWIKALGPDRDCATLKREDGRKLADHCRAKGLTSATIRKNLTMGLAALNHAKKDERIKGDLPKFAMPKAGSPRMRWLTVDEVKRLSAVKKPQRIQDFFYLAFLMGVRSSAIIQVKWSQVDWSARTIDFRTPGVNHKNKRRPIAPINDELLPRLREMYARRTSDYVIGLGKSGRPSNTWAGCKAALAAIGIVEDGVARHVARHTFCSWRVQAGFSYAHIGALVGDTAAMIEKVYGHLSPEHLMHASNMDTSILRRAA